MDVAVLVVDGVADFGFSAVLEALRTANSLRDQLESPPPPWRIRVVSTSTTVQTGNGYEIRTAPLTSLTGEVGQLIVPAVNVPEADALIELVSAPSSRRILELITDARAAGAGVAAACTGTFFLAEAGVLDGAPATTSWWLGPAFRRRYAKVKLDESRTLCRAGRVMTAGAALGHLDLALSLVHDRSPALSELVSRFMMVGNRQARLDFIVPEVLARDHPLVAAFERWVRCHLGESIRISVAARELGATERGLQRTVAAELGMSPRDFVNEIRLERATHLLRTTDLTGEAVAARVGYRNVGTLRGLFRRRRNMSIGEVRRSRRSW
ncbi:GlxA family transcriptional regulator [Amycolatopsis jejuensis]|uniref:GlxA family transcriptional regulator n=1 Tax=Amycolatopsis jejuensis TaxID=330084 RepID=UPI0005263A3E|nr:helix-turn-helix domain-containing protein [Amycolatopsis jejuensis]